MKSKCNGFQNSAICLQLRIIFSLRNTCSDSEELANDALETRCPCKRASDSFQTRSQQTGGETLSVPGWDGQRDAAAGVTRQELSLGQECPHPGCWTLGHWDGTQEQIKTTHNLLTQTCSTQGTL